jgi:hypothetical protein
MVPRAGIRRGVKAVQRATTEKTFAWKRAWSSEGE